MKERYQGYLKALRDWGLKPDEDLVFVEEKPSRKEDSMYEAYKVLKEKIGKVDFDALFCYNDEIAYGAIEALKDAGVAIPEEVAVVGYDDLTYSKLISPSLTSVSFDKYALGYRGVEMLLERINDPSMNVRVELVDVGLEIRESTVGRRSE